MKQKPGQDVLFVEIREPSATRRDVLMSSKDVLDALRRYEEYKALKAEKQDAVLKLKRIMDELGALNRKLRAKLPKVPIKMPEFTSTARTADVEWSARTREKEERFITGPSPSAARPKSKLDVLQEELEKIEERLGALE